MNKRCQNSNCPCRDARIINRRHARFVQATRPDARPIRDPATLTYIGLPVFVFEPETVNIVLKDQ